MRKEPPIPAAFWSALLATVLVLLLTLPTTARAEAPPQARTLERIRKEGVLRWGADPSGGAPFAFFNPRQLGEVVGFEVDIVEKLAEHLGVKVELVRGDWKALVDNLRADRIDVVLNGLEVNEERAKVVHFSTPYYAYRQQLTVRAGDLARYQTLDDLRGKPVAVLGGSASEDILKEAGWPKNAILVYEDSLAPYQEVEVGRADAALAESIIATYYAAKNPKLFNVPKTIQPGTYAAAVRKEDGALLAEINRALDLMKRNGELGTIYHKWGIWNPELERLGIAEGTRVPLTELAEGGQAGAETDWGVTLLLLVEAAQYTLLLTVLAMPLALVLGLGLALMVRSHHFFASALARGYIQVIRGTPLLVQIYLIYYSLPQLGHLLGLGDLLTWNNFVVGVICLAANYAAYEAEIHRAGIEAVPKGQREAALSLGMSERQTFYRVVLPQSFRIILPPVLNDLIAMLKDSCLVSAIGVQELLTVALGIGKARFAVPEMLVAAAILYLLLSLLAAWLGQRLEARLKRRGAPTLSAQPVHH